MSDTYCDITDDSVICTSSVIVGMTLATITDSGVLSDSCTYEPGAVPASSATATSWVDENWYLVASNVASGVSATTTSLSANPVMKSSGTGTDKLIAIVDQLAAEVATATDTLVYTPPTVLLVGSATAASVYVSMLSVSTYTATSSASASSSDVSSGKSEEADSSATAVSATIVLRSASGLSISSSTADDEVIAGATDDEVLLSAASCLSAVVTSATMNALLLDTFSSFSETVFRNPAVVAWLMNTETTALSHYTNFDFESVAQIGDRTFAVGPDGVYELTGDTDDGVSIPALVESGFMDFGAQQTKRMDAIYIGYKSTGLLGVTVETLEGGTGAYSLEQRDATAPRTSRIIPGKGLVGRYWRTTVTNTAGADFSIYDATIDLAVSARRV